MSNVVRNLRNKIWIILSSSFYALILISLIVAYLLSSQRTQDITYQALYSRLFSNDLYLTDTFFSIEMNHSDNVLQIHSDFGMTYNQYSEILNLVLENARDHNTLSFDEHTWIYAITPSPEIGYQRIIFVDITETINQHHDFSRFLIISGLVSFLIVLSSGFVLANYFVKSTKISFEKQAKITSEQKKFTSNATHELRTPITLIKGSFDEILSNTDQTIESQIKWFEMIEFGIQRMETLTTELLTLAKVENREEVLPVDKVDVSSTLIDIMQIMQVLSSDREIQFSEHIQEDVVTYLNKDKFKQLLMILLENAIKYVNDNGTVEVHALKAENQVLISVHNTGPGIPAKDLPRIFERFYRSANTSKEKKGTGLGLPIAKEIANQLGGEISIDSVVDVVTTVILTFPA